MVLKKAHRHAKSKFIVPVRWVLAAAGAPNVESISAVTTEGQTPRAAPRFYPTKGFGRVPASVCRPWSLADRPEDEFGHIVSLAKSMKTHGQVQPALVRICTDRTSPDIKYEVIAGVARWRSALASCSELDIQIRELDDIKAYHAMVAENEERQNLSEL
jgi:hypothetical protein